MQGLEVKGVFIGKAEDIGGDSAARSTSARWNTGSGSGGLGSDEQGDPRFHGGPERALHHWRVPLLAQALPRLEGPSFGENLSTYGLTEEQVCIGDSFRWGEAIIQVSQPRSLPPEPPLGHRGIAAPGAGHRPLRLVLRAAPRLRQHRGSPRVAGTPIPRTQCRPCRACLLPRTPGARGPATAAGLRSPERPLARRCRAALSSGQVEDWNARLHGLPLEGMRA